MPLHEDDRKLIAKCLGHEPGAWVEFVDRYMGLIYYVIEHVAHARSLDLKQADIEDIAAEIFLGIVEDDYGVLKRFKGVSSLPTYLTVVARRICIREVVKRQREAELGHVNAHRAWTGTDEDTGSELEPVASFEEVEQMLKDLPERDAQVIRLYHLRNLNYHQISKELKIPENSVGPILARARKRLRKVAEQRNSG